MPGLNLAKPASAVKRPRRYANFESFCAAAVLLASLLLQSRADQNTRKFESGSQPERNHLKKRVENRVCLAFLTGWAANHTRKSGIR